jgi:hypothetical protein
MLWRRASSSVGGRNSAIVRWLQLKLAWLGAMILAQDRSERAHVDGRRSFLGQRGCFDLIKVGQPRFADEMRRGMGLARRCRPPCRLAQCVLQTRSAAFERSSAR